MRLVSVQESGEVQARAYSPIRILEDARLGNNVR